MNDESLLMDDGLCMYAVAGPIQGSNERGDKLRQY